MTMMDATPPDRVSADLAAASRALLRTLRTAAADVARPLDPDRLDARSPASIAEILPRSISLSQVRHRRATDRHGTGAAAGDERSIANHGEGAAAEV